MLWGGALALAPVECFLSSAICRVLGLHLDLSSAVSLGQPAGIKSFKFKAWPAELGGRAGLAWLGSLG